MTQKSRRNSEENHDRPPLDPAFADLSRLVVSWYRENRRRLPWREEVSPYRTLISEIMLQQTRVEAVKPYFERFLSAFPIKPSIWHHNSITSIIIINVRFIFNCYTFIISS